MLKNLFYFMLLTLSPITIIAQKSKPKNTYKKRVLQTTEINLLTSLYNQNGKNAAVTGGIGTEELTDFATDINVSIPVNDDDVLSINATVSAYTSASSSNLNPFYDPTQQSGASQSGNGGSGNGEDDDDKRIQKKLSGKNIIGTPWVASTGASKSDVWVSGNVGYSHSSQDRNNILSAHISYANEYDYMSFGTGFAYSRLFNQKNTEIGLKANIYLDQWHPAYPTEIKTYIENNGDLNSGFFNGVPILDSNGFPIDKNGDYVWGIHNTQLLTDNSRNSYAFSLILSQILTKNAQISLFGDVVLQKGWLANPMQRVYFSDIDNFYIGNASSIPIYTSSKNKDVFQLADDIERLPDSRLKFPIGIRFNYYVNEYIVLRSYYRYYFDDWGITSHTANIEIPVKVSDHFTLYPSYRFYTQTAADYFAPYETHLSTEKYYTSDYDLSKFNTNQYGFGVRYTDIFTKSHMGKLGFKTFTLNYSHYKRSTGLNSNIITFGMQMILDK